MMDYRQTLEFLYNQLPMYHRIGKAAYKADLHNTIALCKQTGNPQNKFKSIHIGGTNGKGSVAHILASVLQEAGYKTGLHTSPHYKDFRERIKVNGKIISEDSVCQFVNENRHAIDKIQPSFFEMSVVMAFQYFAIEKVDVAVVEVGMGGRLDSTNILNPLLSVITNIGMDHSEFLGNTIANIAAEKAGIIKTGTPVVIGEWQEQTATVFEEKAIMVNAPVHFASMTKSCRNNPIIKHHLNGDYQALAAIYQKKNLITALKCFEVLNAITSFDKKELLNISQNHIEKGLKNIVLNTGFMGRWQIISSSPLVICDSAHNAEAISETVKQLLTLANLNENKNKLHIVFGMVSDRNPEKILPLLPEDAGYYFCKANIPRGLDANILAEIAARHNRNGKAYSSVKNALQAAISGAMQNDVVLVTGSIFVAGESLENQSNPRSGLMFPN